MEKLASLDGAEDAVVSPSGMAAVAATLFAHLSTGDHPGGIEGMAAFTDHLRLCAIEVSLGDVATLVYPQPKRGGLVRVSVGCEDVADLVADVELGLSFVG